MKIDAAQYKQIATAVYQDKEPSGPTPAEAELVVAICQLAVAADDVEDAIEAELFESIAAHVYAHAKMQTTPPVFQPLDDPEQRRDQIRSHAAQLSGSPTAGLAYALSYILAISDLDLAPEEGEFIDDLSEALGMDGDQADDLIVTVTEIITPDE